MPFLSFGLQPRSSDFFRNKFGAFDAHNVVFATAFSGCGGI
jgi:hypothetical protein